MKKVANENALRVKKENHLWEYVLSMLEKFDENSPNENAVLCKILLKIFTPDTQIKKVPLEVVQWWLYSLELQEKQKT